ncbi:MAG: hypothetical protein K2O81_07190 [Clostridia bacterium]|nr:hypothetical protein [Clostridia bacterium]
MKKFFAVSCLLATMLTSAGMFAGCNNGYETYYEAYNAETGSGSSGGSSSGSDMPASIMIPTYCRVSNVRVTKSGSYSVCTGTLTNYNSEYSFRYIKVKGAFKSSSGTVIDTDWTYAVGSEWLEPYESTTFRLSVPYNYSISTCTVTVYTN